VTDTAKAPSGAAPLETVTVVLDGREVQARPDEWLIAVAERAGTYIPRFCYHPRMRPVGMCRMCVVEVKGPRGFALLPACYVRARDAAEVVTTSPKVKKAQDGILELLLINHPLDCPVCDKGGECPLQDQTLAFGPGESRFVEEKRHWEKPIALSSLVHLDRERCIQCDRCTRFALEVAGDPLITFQQRGNRTEINTFPGQPFSSYFSGNTVQICPVGALTAAPYRFRARPWDLEQVESTCTSCAVGCRVAVQSTSNRLARYLGIDSEPVNHGWLCDKGRFAFEYVNSEERLAGPLVRKGDELVPASWSEALQAASQGLRHAVSVHGPASVAVIGGARLANEDAFAWAKLAKSVLGTDSVDAQLGDGLPAEAVLGLPRATIDQACGAKAVVLLAPDLKEELPVLYLRLRAAAVDRGLRIIEMAPASTGMTRYSEVTLAYRPGEAPALARALTAGGPAAGGPAAAGGEPDAAPPAEPAPAAVAGVPASAIAAAREVLAGAEGDVVVVLGRTSLAESGQSVADAAAVLASGLPSARFLPALRRANVHGALDMGLAPGLLPGRVALDAGREWYEQAWGPLPAETGRGTAEILAAASEGRVQGLILLGADPLADFPDRDLARRALLATGLVVSVDTFVNDSNRGADVVLAAAAYSERGGTTTNLEGRITRLGQKIVPPGVAWPDWMIAVELAHRLGGDLGFETIEQIWDEIERVAPSHAGITHALLASPLARDGVVAPLSPETASTTLPGAGGPPRPPALAFAPDIEKVAVPSLDAYSLRLVAHRSLYDDGVLTARSPSLDGLSPPVRLRANPYDLDRLGVTTGGRVRVSSPRGAFSIEVIADPGVGRGSAALAFNLGRESAGALIDAGQLVTDIRLETI